MPFPWSEDTESPKDAPKSGDSWGCSWVVVLPLLGVILSKLLTQLA